MRNSKWTTLILRIDVTETKITGEPTMPDRRELNGTVVIFTARTLIQHRDLVGQVVCVTGRDEFFAEHVLYTVFKC